MRRLARDNVDSRRRDGGAERHLAEDLAVETGRRLVLAIAVDDVGVAGEPDLAAAHQAGEDLGVDGCAKDPRSRSVIAANCDHEVGHPAETQEHIAHEHTAHHRLLEPRLAAVVAVLEPVGALIGEMVAVGVDDAEIDKALLPFVEDGENVAQLSRLRKTVEGRRVGQGLEHRRPLGEEELDRAGPIDREVLQLCSLTLFQ